VFDDDPVICYTETNDVSGGTGEAWCWRGTTWECFYGLHLLLCKHFIYN